MGDLPVATLRPNGSTGCTSAVCIFYVHSDHPGTARKSPDRPMTAFSGVGSRIPLAASRPVPIWCSNHPS